jgi:hypothetical protein
MTKVRTAVAVWLAAAVFVAVNPAAPAFAADAIGT